jgi:hypothetical protein
MGRTRKGGLRRQGATGAHYVILPDGRFKYFSKDPAVAKQRPTDWVRSKYSQTTDGSQAPRKRGQRPGQQPVKSAMPMERSSRRTAAQSVSKA